MVNLSYEDVDNQYYIRLGDSSARASFDLIHGIQALDITGKPFPESSISRITPGIPFPGLTIENITSHIRVWVREPPTWQVQWKDSMLISATDKLMWAVWEAIRRLVKVKYNAGDVTFYIIHKSDEANVIQANACEILANFSGDDVKEANNFARSSSEQLYFQRIPIKLIKAKKVFTLRVSSPLPVMMHMLTLSGTSQLVASILFLDPRTATSNRASSFGTRFQYHRLVLRGSK
jgi:hypothetical protein